MKVAVVIPCRNEVNYIDRCLNSVLDQTYTNSLIKTYVCDGQSDDGTIKRLADWEKKSPFVKVIENKARTTPFALNLGIKAALEDGSDVVIILGAHSELYPDYIENCIKILNGDQSISCVGGILENVYENKTSEVIGSAMSSPFGVGNAYFRTGAKEGFVDTVAFGAYRASVFTKIGLFDEELVRNQDDEYNYRLVSSGGKIFISFSIKCKYFVRSSYKNLFKQYMQYGYWKVYIGKKHKAITTIRQTIPVLFLLYLLFGAVLSIFISKVWILYTAGLVFYFIAALYSALKVAKQTKETLSIVGVFLILHSSYGWGYLKGIIDFLILGKKIKKEAELTR